MTSELLSLLIRINLAAAAAILAVLVLRLPLRRLVGAQLAYGLWAVVPMAGFASLLPARVVAIKALPPLPLRAASETAIGWIEPPALAPALSKAPLLTGADIVLIVWAIVALCALLFVARLQQRSVSQLGGLSRQAGAARLYQAGNSGFGPAVVGALWPRIVVPADFADRFSARERTVVLAHETVHLARSDARINAFVVLMQCLNWFNPLVHVAAYLVRIDQELACDAAVMARYPEARRSYAEALLKTQLAKASLPLGCYWPARSEHPLKERLAMLKMKAPGPARRLMGASALGLLALGAGFAAWSAQPAAPAKADDWWTNQPADHAIELSGALTVPGASPIQIKSLSYGRQGSWNTLLADGSVAAGFVVRDDNHVAISASTGSARGVVQANTILATSGQPVVIGLDRGLVLRITATVRPLTTQEAVLVHQGKEVYLRLSAMQQASVEARLDRGEIDAGEATRQRQSIAKAIADAPPISLSNAPAPTPASPAPGPVYPVTPAAADLPAHAQPPADSQDMENALAAGYSQAGAAYYASAALSATRTGRTPPSLAAYQPMDEYARYERTMDVSFMPSMGAYGVSPADVRFTGTIKTDSGKTLQIGGGGFMGVMSPGIPQDFSNVTAGTFVPAAGHKMRGEIAIALPNDKVYDTGEIVVTPGEVTTVRMKGGATLTFQASFSDYDRLAQMYQDPKSWPAWTHITPPTIR